MSNTTLKWRIWTKGRHDGERRAVALSGWCLQVEVHEN
jgi:hypothetical protein